MKTANIKYNVPANPDTINDTVSLIDSEENSASCIELTDTEERLAVYSIPVKNWFNEKHNQGVTKLFTCSNEKQSFFKPPAAHKVSRSVDKSCGEKEQLKRGFANGKAENSYESTKPPQSLRSAACPHKLILYPIKSSKIKSFISSQRTQQSSPKKYSRSRLFVGSFQAKKSTSHKLTMKEPLNDMLDYWSIKKELESKYNKLQSELEIDEATEIKIVTKQLLKGVANKNQLNEISEIKEKYEISKSLLQQQRILEIEELISRFRYKLSKQS